MMFFGGLSLPENYTTETYEIYILQRPTETREELQQPYKNTSDVPDFDHCDCLGGHVEYSQHLST